MEIFPGSTGCRTSLERVLLLYRDNNCSGNSCAPEEVEEAASADEDEDDDDDDVAMVKALYRSLFFDLSSFRGNDNWLHCCFRLSCLVDGVENGDFETQACASFERLQRQIATQSLRQAMMLVIGFGE
jgi:hypothetical protein